MKMPLSPDLLYQEDGTEVLFVRRWNRLVSALLIPSSTKLVARCAADYGLATGENIFPGNERLARECGLSAETVRTALKNLKLLGMAEVVSPSYYNGTRRLADQYQFFVPSDWRDKAIYGPNQARFTCQHCGRKYNPEAAWAIDPKTKRGGWYLHRIAFCPKPGAPHAKRNGTVARRPEPWCFDLWGEERRRERLPSWQDLGHGTWDLFRTARSDPWPSAAEVAAENKRRAML